MNNLNTPLVAIHCLVYNHEPYLRDCFEGFVMQQTNFSFVAIVHDDASTDNSAAIIREYEAKYPHIFKPIYETENQYSKKDGTIDRIMNEAIDATGAKYVAMCEGDDYWTDPLKLQKQVDFMEANETFSMCFHNVKVLDDNKEFLNLYSHLEEKEYTAHEIYERWTIPTCSVMYRSSQLHYRRPKTTLFGDIVLFLSLACANRIYCLNFEGGVYRRNENGVSVIFSKENYKILYHQYKEMEKLFPEVRDISNKRKHEFLSYIVYDATIKGAWKYRFVYMWEHKKLIFSSFFITTIVSFILKPLMSKQ